MRTKYCRDCNKEKSLTCFPSSGYNTARDGTKTKAYKPVCKPCFVKSQRMNYEKLWNKYFKAECSKCGYNKSKAALDVHHLVSKEKEFTFAQRWSISEKKFAEEAKNCIVLCANCHRELHSGD